MFFTTEASILNVTTLKANASVSEATHELDWKFLLIYHSKLPRCLSATFWNISNVSSHHQNRERWVKISLLFMYRIMNSIYVTSKNSTTDLCCCKSGQWWCWGWGWMEISARTGAPGGCQLLFTFCFFIWGPWQSHLWLWQVIKLHTSNVYTVLYV